MRILPTLRAQCGCARGRLPLTAVSDQGGGGGVPPPPPGMGLVPMDRTITCEVKWQDNPSPCLPPSPPPLPPGGVGLERPHSGRNRVAQPAEGTGAPRTTSPQRSFAGGGMPSPAHLGDAPAPRRFKSPPGAFEEARPATIAPWAVVGAELSCRPGALAVRGPKERLPSVAAPDAPRKADRHRNGRSQAISSYLYRILRACGALTGRRAGPHTTRIDPNGQNQAAVS